MIKVKFYTLLRLLIKKAEVEIEVDKIKIRDLLRLSQEAAGVKFFHKLLEDDGSMKTGTIILLNGKHISHIDNLDTIARKGDVVSLFPPGGGG